MPTPSRHSRGRAAAAFAATALALAVLTTGRAAGPRPAYARPVRPPGVTAATLEATYARTAAEIELARQAARRAGDGSRAAALARMARPGRHFLDFDPRGPGRAVEVVGDLARARTVAVVVPGSGHDLTTFDGGAERPYDSPGGGARAVRAQVRAAGADLAVIAWLGYAPPGTVSVAAARPERAAGAALALRRLVADLRRVGGSALRTTGSERGGLVERGGAGGRAGRYDAGPDTGRGPAGERVGGTPRVRVSLLCHSYGSAVCARAARGLPVDELVAYGSPGMGTRSAAEIGTRARVWTARGDADWIRLVPHTRVLGLGHGADPVSPAYGARVFEAGAAAHGTYLEPGSRSLRNIAGIVLGRGAEPEVPGD